MNVRHLEVFLVVDQVGSFSRAATKLGVSQPALSKMIRDLEANLGVRLFDRTGRGVRLSAAGSVIREHASRVVSELTLLRLTANNLKGENIGEVNIAIPLRTGNLILASLISKFSRQFPNASIHIFEKLNIDIQQSLFDHEMDIGLFYMPPTPSALVFEELGKEMQYAVGRADMFPSDGDSVTLSDLSELPILVQSRPAHYRLMVEQAFREAGRTMSVSRELDTMDAHVSFAIEGEGISILPYSCVWKEVESGTLVAKRIVGPSIWRSIAVAASSRAPAPLVRQTLELLRKTFVNCRDDARWLDIDSPKE